jgi:hypothetical protein
MINWQSVVFNSFWISGLAVLLAAFSYTYWSAAQNGRSLRTELLGTDFLRFFWTAAALVCVGLAGTSQTMWETVLWGGMAILALFFIVRMFADQQSSREER